MTVPAAAKVAVKAAGKARQHKWHWIAAAAFACVSATPVILAVVLSAVLAPTTATSSGCATVTAGTDTAVILATIRTIESGNDYTARAKGSSASGAYQFVDGTWAGYGGYPAAWQAPPDVQDAKATEMVTAILAAHAGDVAVVAVVWYLGHLPQGAEWDTVPVPAAGNTLTPRQYQTKWLAEYDKQRSGTAASDDGGAAAGCDGAYLIPDGVTRLSARQISWGGYQNGRIPLDAMRYSAHSGYMYPPASIAYDAMAQAAGGDGLNIDGWAYRSYEDQAALDQGDNPIATAAGSSNHGWGLAVDIDTLVAGAVGPHHPGYQRAEYRWLQQHAHRWGFCHPDWAQPSGGGPHEPWHWEWCAFMGPAGGFGHGAAPTTATLTYDAVEPRFGTDR